jgi:CubicO group peptidase (beta-lactamase class C family)
MKKIVLLSLLLFINISCTKEVEQIIENQTENIYFPPNGSTIWETKSIDELGWNQNNLQPIYDYLQLKNTKSFIILHNGKIVVEKYFGTHTATTPWYWASAGKTLTTAAIGIAEQEGLIHINNKVSDYIGTGWTSAPLAKENLITCKNLLSMNSGLDDTNPGVSASDLQYIADAGTRWAYHGVFFKLQDVIAQASNATWDTYFNSKIKIPLGMTGIWLPTGTENVYWSNTRSMARFGLFTFAKGKWNSNQILNENYLTAATSTSQNLNLAYGYMWWLNGKTSYRLPQTQFQFSGSLIPNAPNDMFCALGKDDQKIYVVPSKKLVIIRMGDSADGTNAALSDFDNALWGKINLLIN